MRRSLLAALFVLLAVTGAACGDDDDTSAGSTTAPSDVAETTAATGDAESDFCTAQNSFAEAAAAAPEAETLEGVAGAAEDLTAAAEELAASAPEDVREDADALAEAVRGLEDFVATQDYEVGLGGSDPAYQSGEGKEVADAVAEATVPVDEATQAECGRFLNEVG